MNLVFDVDARTSSQKSRPLRVAARTDAADNAASTPPAGVSEPTLASLPRPSRVRPLFAWRYASRFASVPMSQRTASRPSVRAMAEPSRKSAHLPSSFFTMSNSPLRGLRRAASLVPAAHGLRRGLSGSLCLLASPLPSPTTARACARNLGRHQLRPPNRGGRRSAGRRTTLDFVAPVRRDATLARRSRPAQPGRRLSALHRGVCPKPAASPALPEPGQGWLAGPLFMGGCEPRALPSAVTSRAGRHIPAPPAGSSPEDAPHERGWESLL